MDPLSIVADEVALEGLDGITIPTLWIRLENRQPGFPLKLDDCTKEFIWKSLIDNIELRFYKLPQEREDVELFDRFKNTDPETGFEAKDKCNIERRDVYPVHVIPENKDGIQGSCVFFKERKDVTKQIRSKSFTPLLNLQEALKTYGRKLVIVASQALRFHVLIGTESDPDLTLSSDSYCVLERVGRARWQGELQRDLHGGLFKADARKFHYMRKSLVKHDLVTMQGYVRRLNSGQQQHSILLLLKRFHVNRRTKYDILMECVSNYLQESPDRFTTVDMLKEHINENENSFKRLCHYMRSGKFIEFYQHPLEDVDPSAGPCTNKNGSKVLVRCVKLLKPYTKKGVAEEEDEDDEDEEDYTGARRGGAAASVGRIMERDMISQAYDIILSSGTKGVSQRDISVRMNIGALESRMIWRKLLRDGVIKGFMEDVGRQRITKYISQKCVGVSDKLQMFAKERERSNQLYSSTPFMLDTESSSPKTPPTSKLPTKTRSKAPSAKKEKKAGKGGKKDAEQQVCGDSGGGDVGDKSCAGKEGKAGGRSEEEDDVTTEDKQADIPITQSTQAECETLSCTESTNSLTLESASSPAPDQSPVEEQEQSSSASSAPQSEAVNAADNPANNKIVVVDSVFQPQRSHETYRLLKRKNLIIEAVHSSKIIEGLFTLQKLINDEEKQDGFSSKCCKKTVLRLVHNLSREGLLKLYTTTVIQDGITKKVDMIVHPSIQPSDERVAQLLEQIQFKISSSYSAVRLQQAEAKAREQQKASGNPAAFKKSKSNKKTAGKDEDMHFKPILVPGLGKKLGFQPKMHRMRVIHNFLWYLAYGHPLRNSSTESEFTSPTSEDPNDPKTSDQDLKDPQTPDVPKLDEVSGDEDELLDDKSESGHSDANVHVYVDEESWKRFVPPVRVRKDFITGWAMVGDLLLCLPLSIFIQFTQINYKVDGLEEYLNDPIKQHYLVRALPARTKRQLLYKRKYIHVFHENLQKLTYMGLLQFAPFEKFKDKDQVFVYVKRNATIVDTTSSEPHYWLVTEPPDKPFERRHYTFNTAEDVESYWFDMLCVCLNTPLGVIRSKRNATEEDLTTHFVNDRAVFAGLAHLLKGSSEVCDDGSIPGDGKGAAGLDSEFFAHLKRNWLWTNHLLSFGTRPSGLEAPQTKNRLTSLLSRDALRLAHQAGESLVPRSLTNKLMTQKVEVSIEPASRNQQVLGGKGHKRKRNRKEVVRVQRKKRKEPKKRTPAHDEADHKALKMMTKQRVHWSIQEDSVIMLCSVASYLLNSKLKKPFVPYCVVRDLLHAEFEISVDKTSLAVGRRTRYILKNPQTHLNYRICLAEVHQDKVLMKQLEEIKPADPDKPEDCAKAFSKYVRLLRQKFSSVMSSQEVIIPDSKQELFSRFKVSVIDDGIQIQCKDTLNSTEDIHAIVLHNLIQSTLAMTNGQMKTSRSFQTFHTYSQYNQELLCQVFIRSRKKRLLNRRRVGQSLGPKKNRGLPILPMSFQLSQSYYKRFLWRFPQSLCTDSFCFLRSLITNGRGDERPVTTFYHESEVRSQNGEEVLERKTESSKKEKQKGANKDDGRGSESQKQTGAENTKITKEEENQEIMQDEEKSSDETGEKSTSEEQPPPECSLKSASNEASASREQTDDGLPKESSDTLDVPASVDPPDVSDMLPFSLNSPGGACAVSLTLMSLGLLSVFVSIPKQIVVVDSNLVDNDVTKSMAALEEDDDDDDDEEDGAECEGKKRLQVSSHQASHTNYLLMRGYCSPGIVKIRNLNVNDNIVVESCIVRLKLRDTPAHQLFGDTSFPPLDLTKYGPSLLPSILTFNIRSPSSSPPSVEECDRQFIQQRGYTDQDIEACAELRRSLDEAGEKGLDASDLQRAHMHLQDLQPGRTRNLQEYLKDLQEEGQVVRVGSLGIRWVLLQHAEPWLLTVNCKLPSRSHVTSERRTCLKSRHIPFIRKRSRREPHQETEEPTAKKLSVDKEDSDRQNTDESLTNITDKPNEEEQLEEQKETVDGGSGDASGSIEEKTEAKVHPEDGRKEDEGGGETSSNVAKEEKVPPHPEEDDGQEKMETEQKEDTKRRTRSSSLCERDEETINPPTGSAEENVSFISRPWRFIDGKLNRSVCKGMLEAVLYHIMFQPGLTQQALLDHYKDSLQAVVVLDLVEALLELGCVTRKTLIKGPKPSLFTRSAHQTKNKTSEETEIVFYEPTVSCCLRLCRLLPNERNWNDYVS